MRVVQACVLPAGTLAGLLHPLSGERQGGAALPFPCLLLPLAVPNEDCVLIGTADGALLGPLLVLH